MDSVYIIIKVYFKTHSSLLFQIWKKSALDHVSPGIILTGTQVAGRKSKIFFLSVVISQQQVEEE